MPVDVDAMRTGCTAPASGEVIVPPECAIPPNTVDRTARLWWCGLAGLLFCLAPADVNAQGVPRHERSGATASPADFDANAQESRGAWRYFSFAQQPEAVSSTLPAPGPQRTARIEPGPVRAIGTDRLIGAAVGFAVGAGVTWAVLHSGGSTSRCNRSENQDAWSSGQCLGVIAGGGVIGALAGAVLVGVFRSDARQRIPGNRFRLGVSQHGRTNVIVYVMH